MKKYPTLVCEGLFDYLALTHSGLDAALEWLIDLQLTVT
jgi:hypothetical protein